MCRYSCVCMCVLIHVHPALPFLFILFSFMFNPIVAKLITIHLTALIFL